MVLKNYVHNYFFDNSIKIKIIWKLHVFVHCHKIIFRISKYIFYSIFHIFITYLILSTGLENGDKCFTNHKTGRIDIHVTKRRNYLWNSAGRLSEKFMKVSNKIINLYFGSKIISLSNLFIKHRRSEYIQYLNSENLRVIRVVTFKKFLYSFAYRWTKQVYSI